MPSRASRSAANAPAGRDRIAYRTPIPETRNSSGIPHSDPHSKNTVNPALGRGSLTNHDAPAANTTAEWNTTRIAGPGAPANWPGTPPGCGLLLLSWRGAAHGRRPGPGRGKMLHRIGERKRWQEFLSFLKLIRER